jgi:NAD(P)-dependent dehydrogenase (short-subunit alcohol dehydrogenase family)
MVFGGAAPSKDFDPIRDLPKLAGKVVLITGSRYYSEGEGFNSMADFLTSSGIGFASLQHFARLGAKVLLDTSTQ